MRLLILEPPSSSAHRRTELIEVNSELKGDTKFWDKVYREFDDQTVMGGWFEFLATRDLSNVPKFDDNYRFSTEELAKHKLTSLITAYRFLVDYFSREDFLFYKDVQHAKPDLFEHIRFKTIKDERIMIIKKELLYEYFLRWMKLTGEVNKVKSNNFYTDLKDISITAGKFVFMPKTNKKTGIKLSKRIMQAGVGGLLNIDPSTVEINWQIDEQWANLEQNCFPKKYPIPWIV